MSRVPNHVYDLLRSITPFCNVDLIVYKKNCFLLGKRNAKHYRGYWALPGGRIRRNEKVQGALYRIAIEECGCIIGKPEVLGIYEDISKYRHDINLTYLVPHVEGEPEPDEQHSYLKWFSKIPKGTVPFQARALRDAGFSRFKK